MVIRGNIRGNGAQLAQYLMGEGGNDRVRILEVGGRMDASEQYLHQTLHTMSLTAELSRTDKGLYHAQISPAYGEDKAMTPDDWQQAADILAHELGYSEQRRVIVLHTKRERTHAHVVFERYDHETGTVINNKFSRLAQDRARKEMERVFKHNPTPHRNQHRPELKERLTNLWQETDTAHDFIQSVHDNGYLLAEGVPKHPFMVVDENGRSFDLVRQLKGVRIKEVRQRLRDVPLMPEKQAIEEMRQRKEESDKNARQQGLHDTEDSKPQPGEKVSDAEAVQPSNDQDKAVRRATEFFTNTDDLTAIDPIDIKRQKQLQVAEMFLASAPEMTQTSLPEELPVKEKNISQIEPVQGDLISTEPDEDHRADRDQKSDEESVHTETIKARDGQGDDKEQSRERLKAFMLSGDELTTAPDLSPNQQRQQRVVRQFFDNDDVFAQPPKNEPAAEPGNQHTQIGTDPELTATRSEETGGAEHDALLQKLVQEQKALRERKRQGHKKRIR